MRKILTKKFFERGAVETAPEPLGTVLCRRFPRSRTSPGSPTSKTICFLITEVEAYDGFKDKASHAHKGMTKRNFPMFGEARRWYVYFTYGMHWMLNIVTGPRDYPAAVLIRGIVEAPPRNNIFSGTNIRLLANFSARPAGLRKATKNIIPGRLNGPDPLEASPGVTAVPSRLRRGPLTGPAKLTKFLKIGKKFNNKPATRKTGLWLEDRRVKVPKNRIKRIRRVGVDYAGEW